MRVKSRTELFGTYRAGPRHILPFYLDTHHKRPKFFGVLLSRSTRSPDSSFFSVAMTFELDVGKIPEPSAVAS